MSDIIQVAQKKSGHRKIRYRGYKEWEVVVVEDKERIRSYGWPAEVSDHLRPNNVRDKRTLTVLLTYLSYRNAKSISSPVRS